MNPRHCEQTKMATLTMGSRLSGRLVSFKVEDGMEYLFVFLCRKFRHVMLAKQLRTVTPAKKGLILLVVWLLSG